MLQISLDLASKRPKLVFCHFGQTGFSLFYAKNRLTLGGHEGGPTLLVILPRVSSALTNSIHHLVSLGGNK